MTHIQIILDASAIVAYTRGSVAVGELIGEVAFEHGAAGIPVLCLAEAKPAISDLDRLDVLAHHSSTAILGVKPTDWRLLAYLKDTTGRLDSAQALVAAIDSDCDILTANPGLYDGADAGPMIIHIDDLD